MALVLIALAVGLDAADRTTVRVEIVLPNSGRGQLAAQHWTRVIGERDYRVSTVRRGRQPPGIEESNRGRLRTVLVTFAMDAEGTLQLPDRTFARGREQSVIDFLEERQLYGAAGRPGDQPRFGLSDDAFETLADSLARPAAAAASVADLAQTLATVTGCEVRLDDAVRSSESFPRPPAIAQGTAAAWQLGQAGLVLVPTRLPDGTTELRIDLADERTAAWPIGWEIPDVVPPARVAPKLFEKMEYPIGATHPTQFLEAVSASTRVPVLTLRPFPKDTVVETQSSGRRPYAALKRIAVRNRLHRGLFVDDAGRPFFRIGPEVRVDEPAEPVVAVTLPPLAVRRRLESAAATEPSG